MKKVTCLIFMILLYSFGYSQEIKSFENFKFENGHIKFDIGSTINTLQDENDTVIVKGLGKNENVIFEIPPFTLVQGIRHIDYPFYGESLIDHKSLFNCLFEDNKIEKIFVTNSGSIGSKFKNEEWFDKFHEELEKYAFERLIKDENFKMLVKEYNCKLDSSLSPLFYSYEQFIRMKYQKQSYLQTDIYTNHLSQILEDANDYVNSNSFSTTNRDKLNSFQREMQDTLKSFSEALRPGVLVCDFDKFNAKIDNFEKRLKSHFELCDLLLTPEYSLIIDPLLRRVNNKIKDFDTLKNSLVLDEQSVDALICLYRIRENEIINSFVQNSQPQLDISPNSAQERQYEKYQNNLDKLEKSIDESFKRLINDEIDIESTIKNVKKKLFAEDGYNYQYAKEKTAELLYPEHEDNDKLGVDDKLKDLSSEKKTDFITSIYLGSLKTKIFINLDGDILTDRKKKFKNYLDALLSYGFSENSDLQSFNYFIDSLNIATTNIRSIFANDISLMVKRSNPDNEKIRNEINLTLRENTIHADENYISNAKYCTDSIFFLWMANVIVAPNKYNEALNSIKGSIEGYKKGDKQINIPPIDDQDTSSNLFRLIHNELTLLHNSIKDDTICLRKEHDIRKKIYDSNSQYIDNVMKNDSIETYVKFLVGSLTKLKNLNSCLINSSVCRKCITNYYHPQEDILTGLASGKDYFQREIDEFENTIKDYFKVDPSYSSNSTLSNHSKIFITDEISKHPLIFDTYFKDSLPAEKQGEYVRYFFDNHPDKRLEFCPDSDLTANLDNKTQTAYSESNTKNNSKKDTSKNEPFDREPSNSKKEYTEIDEKVLATSLSEKIAPKLNFLNLDTYIGCGIYQLQSDSSEGWLQPICLEFETTLSNNLESPYQPFLRTSFNLYSTRGGSGEFSYGVRFLSSKKNYIAFSPFLEGGYFNVTDTYRKPDSILIKNFYEGEAGVCVDLNKNIDEKIFGSKITLHRLNLKLKASHSISDFNRTYVASKNADEFKSTYWGLSLESSANVGFMKIKGGYKLYRQDYGLSQYLEKERLYNNRWFIQFLININYLKHNL